MRNEFKVQFLSAENGKWRVKMYALSTENIEWIMKASMLQGNNDELTIKKGLSKARMANGRRMKTNSKVIMANVEFSHKLMQFNRRYFMKIYSFLSNHTHVHLCRV